MPSGLDPWRGRTPLLHSLQISSPGEAAHFWELCRREGQLLECRAVSSTWVGSPPNVSSSPCTGHTQTSQR